MNFDLQLNQPKKKKRGPFANWLDNSSQQHEVGFDHMAFGLITLFNLFGPIHIPSFSN